MALYISMCDCYLIRRHQGHKSLKLYCKFISRYVFWECMRRVTRMYEPKYKTLLETKLPTNTISSLLSKTMNEFWYNCQIYQLMGPACYEYFNTVYRDLESSIYITLMNAIHTFLQSISVCNLGNRSIYNVHVVVNCRFTLSYSNFQSSSICHLRNQLSS